MAQSKTSSENSKKPVQKVPEKNLISWSASEYIYYEKTPQYYLIAGIFVVVLFIILIIIKEWMTAFALIVIAAVLYIFSQKKPQVLKYKITNKGINIGTNSYPYNQLKSFWFIESPSSISIHFEPTKRISWPIIIQLGNIKQEKIRKILKKYLPEKTDQKEDYIDKIFRMIRF